MSLAPRSYNELTRFVEDMKPGPLPQSRSRSHGLIEGKDSADWKLVDAHDIIVHIFHPEKREFYDLEKMWSEEIPKEKAMI